MGRRTKARECALQMLYQWDMTQDPIARVVDAFWKVRSTTEATREMADRLARGAHRDRKEVDEAITAASKNWRFERIAAVDKNILRLAVYELMRELQTPSSVILDEAIELAKRFGEKDSAPFVNGVLDAINRTLRPSESTPAKNHKDTKNTKVTKDRGKRE
jgi:transcription antitermination protein NusB